MLQGDRRILPGLVADPPDAGYRPDELVLLRASLWSYTKPTVVLPPELQQRKRGKRGGVKPGEETPLQTSSPDHQIST